jgi:Cof subfamily protein (haloacid dehalogenase superfamily)
MGLKKVIATDLDGTLFYPRKRIRMIGKDNRQFIEKFMDDGGRLLLVSGRNRYFGEKVGANLKRNVDVVGCNGTFVLSNGALIKETFFAKESLKTILKEAQREYALPMVMLFTKHRNIVIPRSGIGRMAGLAYTVYQTFQGTYREPIVRSDRVYYEELEKGEVYKAMLFFGISGKAKRKAMEANKLMRLRYPDAEFSWVDQAIEITPKGCTKSSGIEFYLDYNHLNRDNVLVVGDSGNDISMFESFKEQSFCMEHSPDAVQKHAKHIIKRFYDLETYIYPSEETNEISEKTKEGSKLDK